MSIGLGGSSSRAELVLMRLEFPYPHHSYNGPRTTKDSMGWGGRAGARTLLEDFKQVEPRYPYSQGPLRTRGVVIGLTTSSFSKCCFELRGLILFICNFL